MMVLRAWLSGMVPVAGTVMMECLDVGLVTLSKAAMSRGMNHFVLVVYYNALASLVLFPLSFIFHRSLYQTRNKDITGRPPVTFSHLCKFFFLALPGITVTQNWVFTGGRGSSIRPSNTHLLDNWIIGGLFLAAGCLSFSARNTCQMKAPILVCCYPSHITLISFVTMFGAIQSAAVSLIAARDSNVWKLWPDIDYISIIYSGIVGGVVAFFVQNWCIRRKGPVFASTFKPLGMRIAPSMGVIFLGETLHIGSVIGGVIIATGCYGVAWTQYREEEESKVYEVGMLPSNFEKAPMLDEPQGSINRFDGFQCGCKECNPVYPYSKYGAETADNP